MTRKANRAASYQIVVEVTAGAVMRNTGRQRRTTGIDEATAIATDTRWVGNDNLRALPSHFGIAMQQAGVAGIDFIDDDGSWPIEHRVRLYPATEGGLH